MAKNTQQDSHTMVQHNSLTKAQLDWHANMLGATQLVSLANNATRQSHMFTIK